MAQELLLKLGLGLVVTVLTLVAGVYPLMRQRDSENSLDFPAGESLACGVFLGAALLHMLNESALFFQRAGIHYPLAYLIMATAFLLFLLFEHVGRELYHPRKCQDEHHGNTCYFVLIAIVMLSMHSFLAGAALGLSDEYPIVLILFFAIIAHKWAEAFAISVHLNKSKMSNKIKLICFVLFSLMTPLGIFFGSQLMQTLPSHSLLLPIFSSLAAGTFLYLGTLHGLEKGVLITQCCNLKHFSYVILGFVLMAIAAIWL